MTSSLRMCATVLPAQFLFFKREDHAYSWLWEIIFATRRLRPVYCFCTQLFNLNRFQASNCITWFKVLSGANWWTQRRAKSAKTDGMSCQRNLLFERVFSFICWMLHAKGCNGLWGQLALLPQGNCLWPHLFNQGMFVPECTMGVDCLKDGIFCFDEISKHLLE